MRSLSGTIILGCRLFPSSTLNISYHSVLACSFPWEISCQMCGITLVCYLVLLPCLLNILSLCLVFASLISMCRDVFLLGFVLYGTLPASWTWLTISFSMLGKFSTIISRKIFSDNFFFSSSSETPIIQMLVCLILSQRSLRLSSALFILFTLLFRSYFHHFIFQLTDSFFCFRYSAIDSF